MRNHIWNARRLVGRDAGSPAGATAGFSLVEVAVAVSLLGVLAISVLLVIIPVSRQTRVNRELETAAAEARNILEQVNATPFNEILELYPDGQTIAIDELEEGEALVGYADPTADPLEMQLTLSWESPELGPMSESFFTVRTE